MKRQISILLTVLLLTVIAPPGLIEKVSAFQEDRLMTEDREADKDEGIYDDDIGDSGDTNDAGDTGSTGNSGWEFESDPADSQDEIIPDPGDSEGEGSEK